MALNNGIEEYDGINELKQRLKLNMDLEVLQDEFLIYRFLKARDFNVNLAEIMLKKHLEWRQKNDVENILKYKQPEVLQKYVLFPFLGYDKDGDTVRYVAPGNIDWIGITLSTKTEDLTKRAILELEQDIQRMRKQSEKLARPVKTIYIMNLGNLTFNQATDKNVILNLASKLDMYINNYPETMKATYILNANIYFTFIFAVLKRCLPSVLINRIKVYSDDSWKEELLEVIDADILPTFLGGTNTDFDKDKLINRFVRIPESYYIHKSKRSLASCPGVQKVVLPRAAFHEVNLEVKEPGSYIEWEFETKCRDIGFGLFHQQIIDDEEQNIELISIQRINTDEYAETGLYLCEEEGKYVMVFDNTYSWVRAKELFYRVKIVSPQEQESKS